MRTTGDTSLRFFPRRLAAVASVGAVVAAFAVAGGGAPGSVDHPSPAPTAQSVHTEAPSLGSRYVSTEFSARGGAASIAAPSKPQPPTQAPLTEVLAQPGHAEHRRPGGEGDVDVCSY